MSFPAWYIKVRLPTIITACANYLSFIAYYFALTTLLKTLFAPWKRQSLKRQKPGFDLTEFFYDLSFNLISRGIGFVVRSITFLFGATIFLLALIAMPLIGLVLIILFPLHLPAYRHHRLYHHTYAATDQLETIVKYIIKSPFTKFFTHRTGIYPDILQTTFNQTPASANSVFQKAGDKPSDTSIFTALYQLNPAAVQLFNAQGIHDTDLQAIIAWYQLEKEKHHLSDQWWSKEYLMSTPSIAAHWASGYTPTLDRLSDDLSRQNLRLQPFINRQHEMDQLIAELARHHEPNVLLIGEPGSGRHAIIYGLAKSIQLHRYPHLNHKRMLIFKTDAFLSLTEERNAADTFHQLLDEAKAAGNIILVIPNFHQLLITAPGQHDLSSALESTLTGQELQLIGLTTKADYYATVKPRAEMLKLLTPLEIEAINANQTLLVVLDRIADLEKQHRQFLSYQTVKKVVESADRYITDSPFPEKAFDLLDELISYTTVNQLKHPSPGDVDTLVSKKTKVPVGQVDEQEKQALLNLEATLKQYIVEQDQALISIAKALRRSRSGAKTGHKPTGTFLFLGPTGVGKTETARVLSSVYFGSQKMIRFDMAEYQSADAVERLIGSFTTKQPGQLSTQILSQPFGLLLLDEFEKAPQEIHNLFLSILDEGSFTAADGKKVNCSHLIIIATSNAGSEAIREYLQTDPQGTNLDKVMTEFLLQSQLFPPELLNRFDSVVFYKPLSPEGLKQVTGLILNRLAQKLDQEKHLKLTVEPKTIDSIIQNGYDPNFGARSIERYIQDTIQDDIAKQLLNNPNLTQITI